MQIHTIYDQSLSIVHSINDVQETLFIAFMLVVLVIFAFLGRATDTLIPSSHCRFRYTDRVHRNECGCRI